MEKTHLLLLDPPPATLTPLFEALQPLEFSVSYTVDVEEAWESIQARKPSMIISETSGEDVRGWHLFERVSQSHELRHVPFLFYSDDENAERNIEALRRGAKAYLYQSLPLDEVIGFIRSILYRTHAAGMTSIGDTIVGRLENRTLEQFLMNICMDKHTGVLTIKGFQKRGVINVVEGEIDIVQIDRWTGLEAYEQLSDWDSGSLIFSFQDIKKQITYRVSTLGIFLSGVHHRKEWEKAITKFPNGPDSVLHFTPETLKQAKPEIPRSVSDAISKLDGQQDIRFAIFSSQAEHITAAQELEKLYNKGYLVVAGSSDLSYFSRKSQYFRKVGMQFSPEEWNLIGKNLFASKTNGKILVIGTLQSGKSEFVRRLLGGSSPSTAFDEFSNMPLDVMKGHFPGGVTLTVYGVSLERPYKQLLDRLIEGMSGLIVLVDATRPQEFEYTAYVTQSFLASYHIPFIIAVTNFETPGSLSFEEVLNQFPFARPFPIIPCDVNNDEDIKQVLLRMERQARTGVKS